MNKNIILCSDGTGQKGGYGADSNVYKLYKIVDLYDTAKPQITFYDNGVGTSDSDTDSKTNALWRAMSSAFGFGFEDNVVDLYRFLARNYDQDDNIFFFGFSRGAATVRACVGFIYHCGLLDKEQFKDANSIVDDEKFEQAVEEAISAYRHNKPAVYKSNDDITTAKEITQFKAKYRTIDALSIKFVGVWDTVSALGFPKDWPFVFNWFFETLDRITDNVDFEINLGSFSWGAHWKHRFYDYELNKQVEYAYHALSIDDARETFHPKVWNESKGKTVEQVWFVGVHSNVGGGYPRTELSDIAFDWMLQRAERHGAYFISTARSAVKDQTNPYGKLYDSRDGFGVYYRYQPRNLKALTAECNANNVTINIHETVIQRMQAQTAKYAPSYLPTSFNVVKTDLTDKHTSVIERTVAISADKTWQQVEKDVNKWVGRRELFYRIFVESSLVLLGIILWFWGNPPESVLAVLKQICALCGEKVSHGLDITAWIYDLLHYITPVLFENFLIYVVKLHFFSLFLPLVAIVIVMNKRHGAILKNLQIALEKVRSLIVSAYLSQNNGLSQNKDD